MIRLYLPIRFAFDEPAAVTDFYLEAARDAAAKREHSIVGMAAGRHRDRDIECGQLIVREADIVHVAHLEHEVMETTHRRGLHDRETVVPLVDVKKALGDHNAKKLILIHGIGGHAEAYSRNLRRLGERYHAIAIDLLWHGLSSKPEFTPSMVPKYAEQILDLLDDLGVEKASIEGELLGGWVALWVALHHPQRLDKIVLNTAAGISWNRDKVKIDDAGGSNLLRERSIAAITNPTRETIQRRLEWLMASPDRVTDELVDLRYAPTLALWSDKNPGAGADVGERLAQLVPGASHYCINDAAHWPQWEKPEEHDRVVLAFLDGAR